MKLMILLVLLVSGTALSQQLEPFEPIQDFDVGSVEEELLPSQTEDGIMDGYVVKSSSSTIKIESVLTSIPQQKTFSDDDLSKLKESIAEEAIGYAISKLDSKQLLMVVSSSSVVLDDIDYLKMVGGLISHEAIAPTLQGKYGIEFRDNRSVEKLPAFFVGSSLIKGFRVNKEELAFYKKSSSPVKVVRFFEMGENSQDLVEHVSRTPNQKFIVVCGHEIFRPNVAKVLNSPNIVALVVGPYVAADYDASTYARHSESALNHRDFLRKITDKPILLAVSYISYSNLVPDKKWTTAFGNRLSDFDGFAVYNLATFGVFETGNRESFSKAIGIPIDKPAFIMDFVGTQSASERSKVIWSNKKDHFFKMIKDDGWLGITLLTETKEDAAMQKDEIINTLPDDVKFKANR